MAVGSHASEIFGLMGFAPHAAEKADHCQVHIEGECAGWIAFGQDLDTAREGRDVRTPATEAFGHSERREATGAKYRHQRVWKGVIAIVLGADRAKFRRHGAGDVQRAKVFRRTHLDYMASHCEFSCLC